MYGKILLPLDGSKLAECALDHVRAIASGCGAQEVILLGVTQRIAGRAHTEELGPPIPTHVGLWDLGADLTGRVLTPPPSTRDQAPVSVGRHEEQAKEYLERTAKGLEANGLDVRTVVLAGNPAEQILRAAESAKVDLIIMASHGRSGPSRWAFGSVSDKVLRSSAIPVLMVRAPGCSGGL